jgi:hypothetical protein
MPYFFSLWPMRTLPIGNVFSTDVASGEPISTLRLAPYLKMVRLQVLNSSSENPPAASIWLDLIQ